MKTKIKIALTVVLFITAIMLMLTYAFLPGAFEKLNKWINMGFISTDTAYGYIVFWLGVTLIVIFMMIIASCWILTALMFMIFIPIVLTAHTENSLEKRTKVLLILTVIFAVFVNSSMAIVWLFASIFPNYLIATLVISQVCFIASVTTVIVCYAKTRKYCKKLREASVDQ